MSGLNKVMLIGNLGDNPELKHTSSGTPVANLRLATSRQWNDTKGSKHEDTEWHRVVAWGKQGENCAEHLAKGRQVFIEGHLATREWEDRNGVKQRTTEIIADRVIFLGGKK